ncbi:metallophosphoesterase family protein [Kibdelosporangium lantanae]|uniref:Metallophosphoesterase family protein n=1 Tax=Kibdelosporangium lantanae TaxID=1497396 RepID=A0ABW3MGQ0_9PSEU
MNDQDPEGMTRRQLLRHTAWFGSAVVLTVAGGEVISQIASPGEVAADPKALRFVQLSDSHLGFKGTANTAVEDSFAHAIQQVNSLPYEPDFVMHTGDLTHLSTPAQFDQVKQMMTGLRTGHVFTVPGEHDSVDDHGQKYRQAFGANTKGDGWYSFDIGGVHFISLVNTLSLEKLGHHIPLFEMYPAWGWGTDDAVQALSYLRRFASVTCLNGHVHQLFTKTEGNITFHSATTTAYPLPAPGAATAPTPVTLPAGKLKDALGIREVAYRQGDQPLAVKDVKLA